MKTIVHLIPIQVLTTLMFVAFAVSMMAQEVFIPDPGLNAAIRAALQIPVLPLSEQDMLSLTNLDASSRNISNLQGLDAARNLVSLDLHLNRLTNFSLPSQLTNLMVLDLSLDSLTNCSFPGGLMRLATLNLQGNRLTNLSFTMPPGATNLTTLSFFANQLTNVSLPADLRKLSLLSISGNRLRSLDLPSGLTALAFLNLNGNQLTNVTLPPNMQQLIGIFVDGNPLTTFVLSEPLAATNLAGTVSTLTNRGVAVFTYPLVAQLFQPLMLVGSFKFGITGPPGVYAVLGSTNLATWNAVGVATNQLGSVNFHDVTANASPQKFYRVLLQVPPPNMVFIPPNTFTMGSPTNELHRWSNEGPQTTVTLPHGFWIGKYEVTQSEYLEVTGTNPSLFPGDLSRPVSSVSWPDATNYCWLLTQRELAAGRISPSSQYRLPTEAEWGRAARAGTSTRFSYGDDPDYANLPAYAWQSLDDGLTVHPVGHKLPNPWGLYDLYGNVLEWCQDWLGPLPGGSVTDPQGPASNPVGDKIMGGGAFDFGGSFCRSASRMFFGNHPALTDWNLGFRVVLIAEPQ